MCTHADDQNIEAQQTSRIKDFVLDAEGHNADMLCTGPCTSSVQSGSLPLCESGWQVWYFSRGCQQDKSTCLDIDQKAYDQGPQMLQA